MPMIRYRVPLHLRHSRLPLMRNCKIRICPILQPRCNTAWERHRQKAWLSCLSDFYMAQILPSVSSCLIAFCLLPKALRMMWLFMIVADLSLWMFFCDFDVGQTTASIYLTRWKL